MEPVVSGSMKIACFREIKTVILLDGPLIFIRGNSSNLVGSWITIIGATWKTFQKYPSPNLDGDIIIFFFIEALKKCASVKLWIEFPQIRDEH